MTGPIELWGGVECTVNRVGDRWIDQLVETGHHWRSDDLDRFAALGISAMRYPVLWERTAPDSLDAFDWRWADERMARLRDLGIRPIVGLVHHGSGPRYTSLVDDSFVTGLARFARAVAERYPWVTDYTPVNEPLTTARFSALYGHWHPHASNDRAFVRALLNQIRAVTAAMDAIRQITPAARLIQTEDCGKVFGTGATHSQVCFENDRRWLTWDLLAGRVTDRHPLHGFLTGAGMTSADERALIDAKCAPDIVGLNYYLTSDRFLDERVEHYPERVQGGNGRIRYADVEAVRAMPAGIPGHCAHLLDAWNRYQIPVALTEVHLGCTREEQMRWMLEAWRGARTARTLGADVRAVTAWALLGAYDWDSLLTRDAGRYEPGVFDARSDEPRPTALARLVTSLATSGMPPNEPVLRRPGWWHPRQSTSSHQPLLILGAAGTLGQALARACEVRGLDAVAAARCDCDITNPGAIRATLDRVQPWAVINAAGYVRVDDAESECEACRLANLTGPLHLAEACHSRGVRLAAFSSDLVFDGDACEPYREDAATRPLNVYGQTKEALEQELQRRFPDTLVIRTSAFFGPWDEHNFAIALLRALSNARTFAASDSMVVSPTYVPHLVEATLDLVVDGERGLWHLANDGVISWFEFARTLAARADQPVDLVVPAKPGDAGKAARPRYSPLASKRGQQLPCLSQAIDEFLMAVGPRFARVEACTSS
jgi:dTDP-4-dehydrorhamnose reductase